MFYIKCITQYRLAALMGLCFVALSATAAAPATDLGQSWPHAQDVSASAPWHVYVYRRDNVDYVQVNDAAGTVHAAFATAGDQVLVLPMGVDSQRVSTLKAAQSQANAAGSQVVYRNGRLSLLMTPQAGGFLWQVVTAATAPSQLSTLDSCDSKGECGNHAQASSATVLSADACESKGECGNHFVPQLPQNP